MASLNYLTGYPEKTLDQVQQLIDRDKLGAAILSRYPEGHQIRGNRALFSYACDLKSRYLRKSQPLCKVVYDDRIGLVQQALGLHSYRSLVQGGKLKAKNEIRIASLFKAAPEAFLRMILVHELAHFREKEHNKAFYQLCRHMEPDYHQLEFDLRMYLTHLDLFGPLY